MQKILPDTSFLAQWRDKIEAVVITHGWGQSRAGLLLLLQLPEGGTAGCWWWWWC